MRLLAILAALTVLTLLATPTLAQEVPQPPHRFWGAVTIGDNPATDGIAISAEIDGVTWSTTTTDGKYGYISRFTIPSDDPATVEKDGGVNGDLIVFRVGGVVADEWTFESGGHTELDLSIEGAAPTVTGITPTSGTTAGGTSVTITGTNFISVATVTIGGNAATGVTVVNATTITATTPAGTAGAKDVVVTTTGGTGTLSGGFTYVASTPAPAVAGGGGGGAPTYYAETNLFGTEKSYRIDSDGEIRQTIEATSEDGNLTITIPKGTTALGKDGKRLKSLEAAVDERSPDPPEDTHIIGLAYDFEPEGATFDPPITLTWSYDPDALPEGVAEEDLVLAYYDEEAGEWVELDCVVDTENKTITASVSHFTTFAIIGTVTPPAPAPTPAPTPTPAPAPAPTPAPTPAPPPAPTPAPAPAPAPAPTPATTPPATTPPVTPPTPTPTPWPLIGGIIGGAIVVGLIIFFLVRRRAA